MEELLAITDPSGTVAQALHLANATITLPSTIDLGLAFGLLAAGLHVEPVDGGAGAQACALYGRSVQNHHVIVLAKALPPSSLTVEIKCDNAQLAAGLINEANALFHRQ